MEEQSAEAIDNRQEEHGENDNKKNAAARPENFEQWEFALSILKEAVASVGIKDISEYKGEPLKLRWHVFSKTTDADVILKLLVQGNFGLMNADVLLIMPARWIVEEVENVLNQPNATRILDFKEEERNDVLRENVRMILTRFINQIPVVAFHVLDQALNDAVQSHIKTYVEPLLKEHWQSMGLPKGFTISPSEDFINHHKSVDEQFKTLRQGFLGNKRAWLTDEKRARLDEEHEQLRSQYQTVKDYYHESQKAFFAGQRNRTEDDWTKEWESQSTRIFPALNYRCLTEINHYPPYELAYIHLADSYGYSPEYIRKLVTQASALKSSKV